MQFNLTNVSAMNRSKKSNSLDVALVGSDGSIHNFKIDTTGKDVMTLTLRDIERLAIQHAKNSFANCSNG
ncbi:TPA: hypothetical protein ACS7XE_002104 [Providencia alcalifaciens]|uniref:hypothetical protein n=1 Tax=Providencia alcalifaciens TaxID=126385 RepID=UPI000D9A8B9C|nr:hypothetical protein [Providencia alcalifaciens]MTC25859.1 hypothetical protein [Providencia alcalifaciens]SPY70424.1 Uncharacterised protein [Providencia alcalifaciens]